MYMYVKGQCIFGKKSNLTRKVGVFQTHFTSLKVFPWIHFPHALLRTFHSTKCRNDARSWLTPACFGVGIPWPSSRAVISYADAVMALEVQWGSAEHSWGGIPSFVLQLCESSAPLFFCLFLWKEMHPGSNSWPQGRSVAAVLQWQQHILPHWTHSSLEDIMMSFPFGNVSVVSPAHAAWGFGGWVCVRLSLLCWTHRCCCGI